MLQVSGRWPARCEDFLAVADPSELTLQLSCPIGSADTASNQLQYATIDGSLGYIIETMPAVRAIVWSGERQFQVEVDEVTKLEWTATASGRATDVSANKGDLAPGSPAERLVELWDASASS